ncbi:MAG TPA: NPCBM/NEW2 domain-containing protein [Candidatus Eisenbergiella merdavium]|uniref:NPCBM/NEW2 domain-containing protein n=1 Tax=Candidatus Eisenbergiella merdavium TaxID=2838551 RepID=A0A9D2NEL1_9FIRM|nr:NPCBM/NEW2 domain-containing protein [Candidatus Eisenbergiella merdavium]
MRIITPLDGQQLTDIALHFVWEPDEEADRYQIEFSETESFEKPLKIEVLRNKSCEVDYYLPQTDEELIGAGDWYVRILSDRGRKTQTIRLFVNEEHSRAPLKTEISPEHPYFTIFDYSEHRYGATYEILPDDLKPYAAISTGGAYRVRTARLADSFLDNDRKGYPWHMGSCGPKEVSKGKYVVTPLSVIEYVMQNAANLKSVGALEIYMGVRKPDDWHIPYINRLIRLCGKYGLPFLYTDGNRNDIDFPAVIKREDYMETIRSYSDYVVLSYKQNHANASYTCYGSILGAWKEGAVKRVGLQAENWYWNDAGFCDDVGNYHGYLQGNEQQIPAAFTAQMLLAGVSYGATYYSLEGEGWLIEDRDNGNYELSPQGIAFLSMFRTVIANRLIPSREEVMNQIHAVVAADGLSEDWGDAWTGGVFRKVFQNLYDIRHTKELFPKQTRYFYLPFMTDREEAFSDLVKIDASAVREPDDVNRILDPLYPKWFEGDAYVTHSDRVYIIMNSNENTDLPQTFAVDILSRDECKAPVIKAEGSLGLWQYLIIFSQEGKTRIHANAPEGKSFRVFLTTENGKMPFINIRGEGVSFKWDVTGKRVEMTLEGSNLPIDAELAEKEEENSLPLPIRNPDDKAVYLTDMPVCGLTAADKGMPAFDHCANEKYGILPIAMNSIRYRRGVSMPRQTSVSWKLGKKYHGLSATTGFDIDCWMPIIVDRLHIVWDRYVKEISFYLKIWGDGRLLYESAELKNTSYRERIDIDVTDVDILTFEVNGDIFTKPLVGAVTGSAEEFLFDVSGMKEEERPGIEVYLDCGNPILS